MNKPIPRNELPAIVRQEIEEWVATVAPAKAQHEFRSILRRVAELAYREGEHNAGG